MVTRETTFQVGGILVIGLGLALGVGLYLSGAGVEFLGAWLGAGVAVGFGAFFLYVGRAESADRRRALHDLETTEVAPPGPGPK